MLYGKQPLPRYPHPVVSQFWCLFYNENMIKRYFCFAYLIVLCSCEQQQAKNVSTNTVDTVELRTEAEQTEIIEKQEVKANNQQSDWLNPKYLIADFNGDSYTDTAFAVIVNNQKGIRIKHANTNEEFILGAGNDFGNGGKDFNWVDEWKLVNDTITYEVTFTKDMEVEGNREVKLDHTAFYIGNEELGGATVAWRNGKYVWIHQAD